MKNRGQLTIFIILAILIIAIIVLFFTFKDTLKKPEVVSPETAEIQNFVRECLDDSLEKVVFRIGEGGGYYFPPKVSTPLLDVPYYIKDNKNLMSTKEDIELEISKYVKRELVLCAGNFALFPEYQITKGEMSAKTIIESERVLIDINYPLTIKKIDSESKTKIEDFSSEIPVRFGIVYDAVFDFIEEDLIIEGECASCLLKILGENDLYSNSFDYDNKTRIFMIRDYNSIINKKEFVYNFANEY